MGWRVCRFKTHREKPVPYDPFDRPRGQIALPDLTYQEFAMFYAAAELLSATPGRDTAPALSHGARRR